MAPTRGVRDLRPYESDLIRQGFKKGTNSLGVTYYAEGPSWGNHGKPEYGWVEASDGSGKWTRVPWHLIENPYDGGGGNPSGPTREVDTGQPGREMTAAALGESVPILYGEVLLGGDVFFQRVAGNAYWASYGISQGSDFGCGGVQGIFAQVGESALYPIASQGFYGIYWEDKPGTLTQTASTFMQEGLTNSGSGTIQEQVYPGLAYVAVKQISGYTPSEPKFLYRGLKVYDPRLDATLASIGPTRNSTTVVWSDNDALCLADYLQADYGAGYGMSGVDWDSVIEAANYCDVDVGAGQVTDCIVGSMGQLTPTQMLATTCTFTAAPGGGVTATGTPVFRAQTINDFTYYELIGITITNPGSGYLVAPSVTFTFGAGWNNQCTISSTVLGERRHRMNILLRRPASVKSTIETLRQHFRCYLRERAGKVVFLIDKPRASVYTLTKDTARPLSGGRKGSSSVPNGGILNFTNRNKSWQQDEFRVETENVKFGIEEFRPAEWSLLGITRQNEIGRQGSYLVGKERLNLNSGLEIMTSDGFQFEKYDRVTYVEDVLALDSPGVDFVINSIEDDSEGKFVAKISLYDEAIYVDTVGVVEVAPPVNIQNPFRSLPAPLDCNLSEIVDSPMPGLFIPKVLVEFTPRTELDFYGGTRVTYSIDGEPERSVGTYDNGPVPISIPEGFGRSVTVFLYTVNRNGSVLSVTPMSNNLILTDPNVPEPPGRVFGGFSSGYYWDAPPGRVKVAASWSSSGAGGVTAFDATKFEDGSTGSGTAAQFNNASDGWIIADFGVARDIREFVIHTNGAGLTSNINTNHPNLFVQFADSLAGPWTTVTNAGIGSNVSIAPSASWGVTWSPFDLDRGLCMPVGAGSHRYWRLGNAFGGGSAVTITEIESYLYTGNPYPYVVGYRIRGLSLSTQTAVPGSNTYTSGATTFVTRDLMRTPTSGNLYAVEGGHSRFEGFITVDPVHGWTTGVGGGISAFLEVATISATGVVSEYRSMYRSKNNFSSGGGGFGDTTAPTPYITQDTNNVILANGTNNDVAGYWSASELRITGPTATAYIAGLTKGHAGAVRWLRNETAYLIYLEHEGAGSTAANRFALPVKYIAIPPGGVQAIIYDNNATRWRLADQATIERSPFWRPKYVNAYVGNAGAGVDNTIYTCPSGRKAMVLRAGFKNTVAANISYRAYINIGGFNYRIMATGSVTTSAVGNLGVPAGALSAGDSLILRADSAGVNFWFMILEFDILSPVSANRVVLAAGDNAIYTCPAGFSAASAAASGLAGTTSSGVLAVIGNESGVSSTYEIHHVPSGGAKSTATLIIPATATANFGTLVFTQTGGMVLNSGDVFLINSTSGTAGQMAFATFAEYPNPV